MAMQTVEIQREGTKRTRFSGRYAIVSDVPLRCPKCDARYHEDAVFCQVDGARLEPEAQETDPYVGVELLGQFRIEKLLGQGGMGRVYRAEQPSLGRHVAVKILHRELAESNPDAIRRFRREARVTTSLQHPNVVDVMLYGEMPDGSPYMVMEYLDGVPLHHLMAQEGRVSLRRAMHIGIQVADGVGKAHESGIVHRDVKPENIIIGSRNHDDNFVKVLDFGIARLLWDKETVRTKSGLVFGTARYISPEGATGEATDARSDVYSIAVVLYQLLAGRPPFPGSAVIDLLMAHVNEKPTQISELVPDLPRSIAMTLMRALSKRPGDRPETATKFAEELRAACFEAGLTLDGLAARGLARASRESVAHSGEPRAAGTPTATVRTREYDAVIAEIGQPPRRTGMGRVMAISALMVAAFVAGASALLIGAYLAGAFAPVEEVEVAPLPDPESSLQTPGVAGSSPPVALNTRAAAISVEPAAPRAGQRVRLVGVTAQAEGRGDTGDFVFRVRRGGRSVGGPITARRHEDGSLTAPFRFRRPGEYELSFGPRGADEEHISLVLVVPRRRVVSRTVRRPSASPARVSRTIPEAPGTVREALATITRSLEEPASDQASASSPEPASAEFVSAPSEPWPGAGSRESAALAWNGGSR